MFFWRMAYMLIKEARYYKEMTHRSYICFCKPSVLPPRKGALFLGACSSILPPSLILILRRYCHLRLQVHNHKISPQCGYDAVCEYFVVDRREKGSDTIYHFCWVSLLELSLGLRLVNYHILSVGK